MTSDTESILSTDISISVFEEVRSLEVCGACLLSLIEGFQYGYIYAEPEDLDDSLRRAYDIIFDETLKRLESQGIHLPL